MSLHRSSEEEEQAILHFQELSGLDGLESSRKFLEDNDWNLEAALNSVFVERDRVREGKVLKNLFPLVDVSAAAVDRFETSSSSPSSSSPTSLRTAANSRNRHRQQDARALNNSFVVKDDDNKDVNNGRKKLSSSGRDFNSSYPIDDGGPGSDSSVTDSLEDMIRVATGRLDKGSGGGGSSKGGNGGEEEEEEREKAGDIDVGGKSAGRFRGRKKRTAGEDNNNESVDDRINEGNNNRRDRLERQQHLGNNDNNNTWFSFVYNLLIMPFHLIFTYLWSILTVFRSFFIEDQRLTVTDPLGDVKNFLVQFEALVSGVVRHQRPNFLVLTYGQAIEKIKADPNFLVVYLHDPQSGSRDFCRNILCNSRLVELFNSRSLIWGCNIESPEGFRVQRSLLLNRFPCLAVVGIKNNVPIVLVRFQNKIAGADSLLQKLQAVFASNEAYLWMAKLDRQERRMTQDIRKQQDVEYSESLRLDQEKERRKQMEKEGEETRAKNQIKKLQRFERQREYLKNKLESEPDSTTTSGSCQDTVKILFKLPNGTRIERTFRKTASADQLYILVCLNESWSVPPPSGEDGSPSFQIVTNFPRRVIGCSRFWADDGKGYNKDGGAYNKDGGGYYNKDGGDYNKDGGDGKVVVGGGQTTLEQLGFGRMETLFVNQMAD